MATTATDDIQSKINNANSLFDNMLGTYKSNYVNYHKNVTLSMPTLTPTSTTTTNATTAGYISSGGSDAKNLNDEVLLNYRYAVNDLLEQVRSQMSSN